MNVKKEVIRNIKTRLERDQSNLRYECKKNSHQMKKLAFDNEVMKREIAKIGDIIKSIPE